MTSVEVAVQPEYRVLVGNDLLESIADHVAERTVAVVSDSNVGPRYAQGMLKALRSANRTALLIEVAAGEDSKSLSELENVLRGLARAGFRRDCAIVSLGGGVISDLAGFAAASYLRGVPFYACPTSLLAMVDASVGGKTGVNLPEGKNLVGAFWQPRAVLADVTTLSSLPEKQFREGTVELYKHGLLAREDLLGSLDDPDFRPDGDPRVLERYVAESVAVKAEVVAADERESGERAHLNLGHSLAHALEAVSDHRLSHGEAVAYGLLFAALLGRERGWYDFSEEALRLLSWLQPSPLPCRDFDQVQPYLLRDKKNSAAGQRFVLLAEPRRPVLVADVDEAEQRRAWQSFLEVLA